MSAKNVQRVCDNGMHQKEDQRASHQKFRIRAMRPGMLPMPDDNLERHDGGRPRRMQERELPMQAMRTAMLSVLLSLASLVVPPAAAARAAMPVDATGAFQGAPQDITTVRLVCDSYGCRDVGPRRQPRRYRPPPPLGSEDRPINPRPPGYYRPPPRPGYSQPRTPPQRYRPAPLPRYGIGKD
jgi:hypothetical protein